LAPSRGGKELRAALSPESILGGAASLRWCIAFRLRWRSRSSRQAFAGIVNERSSAVYSRDPSWAIAQARRFLSAGAEIIMIESEGITENVDPWRTDVPAKFIDEIGMEKLMFEAADPDVFAWYIKNYGADVNLFVDHSQIVQLECLRAGIWGTKSLWGRVVTYRE
jgi:hypothetical protein